MPEVDTILVGGSDPNCPFGAKEPGRDRCCRDAALANAIFDAVAVRIDDCRSRRKILRALDLKAKGKNPRVGPEQFPSVRTRSRFMSRPWEGGTARRPSG